MPVFKPGEGKLARRVAFYSGLLLIVWGSKDLAIWLRGFDWAKTEFGGGFRVPFYSLPPGVAVFVAIGLAIVLGFLLFRYLNKENPATLLIDSETELKKVTWPNWPEAKQATLIVLIFVAFISLFLTSVEFVLKNIFDLVLSIGA